MKLDYFPTPRTIQWMVASVTGWEVRGGSMREGGMIRGANNEKKAHG